MEKVIPILPCTNIQRQVQFYENMGFEIVELITRPYPYVVVKYNHLEIHFYTSKKLVESENPNMCIMQVDNVDEICTQFSEGLKKAIGSIPRSGIPKVTKVRDLKSDRRFTITDTGGNTIYVCTPVDNGNSTKFRELNNQEHSEKFAVLYDFLYSKEDKALAEKMYNRLLHIKDILDDEDKAKFLLIELELNDLAKDAESNIILKELISKNKEKNNFWIEVQKKYDEISGTLN